MEYNRKQIIQDIIMQNTDLILICGISSSGKTTISEHFANNGYYMINANEDNLNQSFDVYLNKCISLLNQNKKCIFEYNHTTIKKRSLTIKKIINQLINKRITISCVYVDVDLQTALFQNSKKINKNTSEKYIIDEYNSQILPIKEYERYFNYIYILHEENFMYKCGYLQDILNIYYSKDLIEYCKNNKEIINNLFPEYVNIWGFDQKTSYHNLKLDDHILSTTNYLKKTSLELFLAGLLHDIGKPLTQIRKGIMIMDSNFFECGEKVYISDIKKNGFVIIEKTKNNKYIKELVTIKHVVMDKNYNYYNHENVSARIARKRLEQLMFTQEQCNIIYRYILYHMTIPTDQKHSKKTLKKVLNKIGKDIIIDVIKMKLADKFSSNMSKEHMKNLYYNISEIKKIIKGE